MIDDLRFEIHAFRLLPLAFLPLPFALSCPKRTDLYLYAPPYIRPCCTNRTGKVRNGAGENAVSPNPDRNKKNLHLGAFWVPDCCTNRSIPMVVWSEYGGGSLQRPETAEEAA